MKNLVLNCLESRVENNHTLYGRFLLAPFKNGNALTLGTALRRALLSEIQGIAITALDIQGITHEFSTIEGVRESVLEISLNFQRIILRDTLNLKKVQVGYLQIQGPAVVYANDLKLPRGIECVDPTQYIATLSRDGLLVLKFLIETGTQKSHKKNNSLLTASNLLQAKQVLKESNVKEVDINAWPLKQKSSDQLREEKETSEKFLAENDDLTKIEKQANKLGTTSKTIELSNFFSQNSRWRQEKLLSRDETLSSDLDSRPSFSSEDEVSADSVARRLGAIPFAKAKELRPFDVRSDITKRNFISNKCLQQIIPLDVFVAPVNKVNFVVQTDDVSIGARERLVLEVWTNGSIHPRQAIHSAALSLITLFSEFRNLLHLDSHSKNLNLYALKSKPFNLRKGRSSFALASIGAEHFPSEALSLSKEGANTFKQGKKGLHSELQINLSKRFSLLYKSHLEKTSLLSSDLSNLSLSLKTYIFLKQKGIQKVDQLLYHSSRNLLQLVNGNKNMFYEIKRCLFVLGLQGERGEKHAL